jgi:NET1-associated nuclear protein 1 (U3 small nucleolar RNA-associated protein 17)
MIPTADTSQLPVQKPFSIRVVGKARYTHGLSYSPSGAWLVAIGGHKAYVCRTSDIRAGFTKLVSPEKLTCLAFHPTDDFFATGDSKGLVRLWYCLNDSIPSGVAGVEKKAPTTTLHWHAHAVSSLAFTANGAYLLSGGEEAVLVIWQLHTGKKEFIPRVGAPITSVTLSTSRSREEEYLLGLSDASFVFIRSGSLRISRTIAKVKLGISNC